MSVLIPGCVLCGSPLPLSRTGRTTCAYCLEPQDLPPEIVGAVGAEAAIGEDVDRAVREVQARFSSAVGTIKILAIVAVVSGMCFAAVLVALGWEAAARQGSESLLTGLVGVSISLVTGTAVWAGIYWAYRSAGQAKLAGLPRALPRIGSGVLQAGCARCGAPLACYGSVSTRCGFCGSTSLLPQALVRENLRKRVRAAVRMKSGAHQAHLEGHARANRRVMMILLGLSFLIPIVGTLVLVLKLLLFGE